MGWKVYQHQQPSGRVVHRLAFYHKRTKTLHVLKGKQYKLLKSYRFSFQKRHRDIDHVYLPKAYAITQILPNGLSELGITSVIVSKGAQDAIRIYKRSSSYIQHTMYLPNGQIIPPPPLSYAVTTSHHSYDKLAWKTLNKPDQIKD